MPLPAAVMPCTVTNQPVQAPAMAPPGKMSAPVQVSVPYAGGHKGRAALRLQVSAQGIWADDMAPQRPGWLMQLFSGMSFVPVAFLPPWMGANGWWLACAYFLLLGLCIYGLSVGRWRGKRLWLVGATQSPAESGASSGADGTAATTAQSPWLLNLGCDLKPHALFTPAEVATLRLVGPANRRSLQCLLHSGEVVQQRSTQWLGNHWVDLEPALRQWMELWVAQCAGSGWPVPALQICPPTEPVKEPAPRLSREPWRDGQGIFCPNLDQNSVAQNKMAPAAYHDPQWQAQAMLSWRGCVAAALASACVPAVQPWVEPWLKAWGMWALLAFIVLMLGALFYIVLRRGMQARTVATCLPLALCEDGVLLLQMDYQPQARPLALQVEQIQSLELMRIPRMPFGRVLVHMRDGRELQQRINAPWLSPDTPARAWLAESLQQWLRAERVQVHAGWQSW